MKIFRMARKAVRRAWMKHALRGVGGSDNYTRLDLAYRISDPWNMESELERMRFERTNEIIGRNFPACNSILEIGCGEGHQTAYFQRLCASVYGLDVSETAVARARERVPTAQFATGDIFSQPWGRQKGKFELVVACEVLYYISDIEKTLREMNYLGRACMVTIFAPGIPRVGPFLENQPGIQKDWFGGRGAQWVVAYWRNSEGKETA